MLRTGVVPARVGSACSGDGPCRQIKVEEANGGNSGQKGDDFAVFFLGSVWL